MAGPIAIPIALNAIKPVAPYLLPALFSNPYVAAGAAAAATGAAASVGVNEFKKYLAEQDYQNQVANAKIQAQNYVNTHPNGTRYLRDAIRYNSMVPEVLQKSPNLYAAEQYLQEIGAVPGPGSWVHVYKKDANGVPYDMVKMTYDEALQYFTENPEALEAQIGPVPSSPSYREAIPIEVQASNSIEAAANGVGPTILPANTQITPSASNNSLARYRARNQGLVPVSNSDNTPEPDNQDPNKKKPLFKWVKIGGTWQLVATGLDLLTNFGFTETKPSWDMILSKYASPFGAIYWPLKGLSKLYETGTPKTVEDTIKQNWMESQYGPQGVSFGVNSPDSASTPSVSIPGEMNSTLDIPANTDENAGWGSYDDTFDNENSYDNNYYQTTDPSMNVSNQTVQPQEQVQVEGTIVSSGGKRYIVNQAGEIIGEL